MALEAIVSVLLEQLTSIALEEVKQQLRRVVGVEKEVKNLTNNFRAIQAVLIDAERRQLEEVETVRVWLDELKDASYDVEDVLDEWNTAMLKLQVEGVENTFVPKKKVCFFFPSVCFCLKQVGLRHDIAIRIKHMNGNMNEIVKRKDIFNFAVIKRNEVKLVDQRVPSTYLVDVDEIRGRVEDKSNLVKKLCENNEKGLHIISIVGMGGIGKTTLAQFAYNHNKVINNFDIRIWVCVSDPFDEHRIAKAIIEALEDSATNLVEFNSLIKKVQVLIKEKKFLLVLDDVWTEDYNKWEPFYRCLKNGLCGSKILVTTRKETVAHMMESVDIINVKELSEEECWSLFQRFAFFGRSPEESENLKDIGRKIVEKCKGLPLAAKTIGSLLRFKKAREEWQYILDSEMWKLKEFEKGIFPPLLLSYNDLPFMVKQCFSYCSIFSKDCEFDKDELIKLWMAQGYLVLEKNKEMEIIGENYFSILASRSFFQEFEKDDDGNIIRCKMHDIVHDFTQYLRKKECFMVGVNVVDESFTSSSHEKIRRLMLKLSTGASFPISISSAKRMRSLLIDTDPEYSLPNDVLPILFGELTCLRTLALHTFSHFIYEIPIDINKMKCLRYLDLGGINIEKLPETLCELYNLQTLDISCCAKLKELPQGMGKLINLRHLINNNTYSLSCMPVGMERLTSLRTLSEFVASGVGDHSEGNKASGLEYLKNLNNLRGSLGIRRLGDVGDAGEVNKAKLINKTNLVSLRLNFRRDHCGERQNRNNGMDEAVSEALQPPPNLERLEIHYYEGKTLCLNWMVSLTKLRFLKLINCVNLEEWDISKKGDEDITIIMPSLHSLKIWCCWKLKSLPDHILQTPTLKELKINFCPILSASYNKETGADWIKISHIPNISIW